MNDLYAKHRHSTEINYTN